MPPADPGSPAQGLARLSVHRAPPSLPSCHQAWSSPSSSSTRECVWLCMWPWGADREGHASRALQRITRSCVSVDTRGAQRPRLCRQRRQRPLLGLDPPLGKLGVACHGLHGLCPIHRASNLQSPARASGAPCAVWTCSSSFTGPQDTPSAHPAPRLPFPLGAPAGQETWARKGSHLTPGAPGPVGLRGAGVEARSLRQWLSSQSFLPGVPPPQHPQSSSCTPPPEQITSEPVKPTWSQESL